jgi:hypothetical protein
MLAAIAFLSVALASPDEHSLCNYAKIVGPHGAPVLSRPDRRGHKEKDLPPGTVVYTCDEQGEFLEVYFGTPQKPCAPPAPKGLDFRKAQGCASGWVRKARVNVLSG